MSIERFVVLDRDGVINEDSDAFIKSPEEWAPIPGSLEAISVLSTAGFKVVVATNQSGIARGLFSRSTLSAIHRKMQHLVAEKGGEFAAIYYCPHGPGDGCECRKPMPGLLKAFGADFGVDLKKVIVVGDSLRDLEAATAVGAQPILVKTGKGLTTLKTHPDLSFPVFDDLYDAAKFLASNKKL